MKIGTKLGGGYLLVFAMVLLCGVAGFYGINRLSTLLDYISGPVWDTADGAMEGSIGIEAEMLGTGMIVSGQGNPERAKALLDEGRQTADEALGRMISAGLMSDADVNRVKTSTDSFREAQTHLLHSYQSFDKANKSLDADFDRFQELMVSIESLGDAAVEKLEGNPDQPITWNSGLAESWGAADGGMETQIALLQRFYFYQRLITATNSGPVTEKLAEALDSLREKGSEVIDHPLFQQKIRGGAYAGKSFAQALNQAIDQHESSFDTAIRALGELKKSRMHYDTQAESFLATIGEIEEIADGKIEGQAENIAQTQTLSYALIGIAMLIGLIISVAIMYLVVREIIHAIQGMSYASQKIADGDLTIRVCKQGQQAGNDELINLNVNMERMTQRLRETLSEVSTTSSMLASQAEELSSVAKETTDSVMEQQDRTTQVASAITEMSASSKEVADNTIRARDSADQAEQEAQKGQQVVTRTIESIRKLAQDVENTAEVINQLTTDSERIGSVLDVIQGIADQTNLLALNAAIEAARAGEQGRGFAVVADEVRTLAQRTQESTQEIQTVIAGLQSRTRDAYDSMGMSQQQAADSTSQAEIAGGALEIITREVQAIVQQNTQIAAAVTQQLGAADEISESVVQIESKANQAVTAANQTSESSHELARQASSLQTLVSRFKI